MNDETVQRMSQQIAAISRWIDAGPSYQGISPEAAHWRRLSKVGEEFGEVMEAHLGFLGENPRKGKTNLMDKVEYELLDVALSALGALEHLTGNIGQSMGMLDEHIAWITERAGEDLVKLAAVASERIETLNAAMTQVQS